MPQGYSPHLPVRRRSRPEPIAPVTPLKIFKGTKIPSADSTRESKPKSGRLHVTFAPTEGPATKDSSRTHRPRPSSGRAEDVTALDHQIARHGGTTSTLDNLPHRMKQGKEDHQSREQHLVSLTRENGYLRQELAYYKDTREVLMQLYDAVRQSHQELKIALDQASRGVAISEQRLIKYWAGHVSDGSTEEAFF